MQLVKGSLWRGAADHTVVERWIPEEDRRPRSCLRRQQCAAPSWVEGKQAWTGGAILVSARHPPITRWRKLSEPPSPANHLSPCSQRKPITLGKGRGFFVLFLDLHSQAQIAGMTISKSLTSTEGFSLRSYSRASLEEQRTCKKYWRKKRLALAKVVDTDSPQTFVFYFTWMPKSRLGLKKEASS